MIEDICGECGNPRRRNSNVYVVDGELVPLFADDPRTKDAPTVGAIREFYLEVLYYAMSKGFRNPQGWTCHKTIERFRLDGGKRVIEWHGRDLEPVRTTDATARWLRADWQRQKVAQRYASA